MQTAFQMEEGCFRVPPTGRVLFLLWGGWPKEIAEKERQGEVFACDGELYEA